MRKRERGVEREGQCEGAEFVITAQHGNRHMRGNYYDRITIASIAGTCHNNNNNNNMKITAHCYRYLHTYNRNCELS